MDIKERNKEIIRKRNEGMTLKALAKEYGISHVQIMRICKGIK